MRSFGIVTHVVGPLRIDDAQRTATRESIRSGTALTGPYLAMNAAATLIAGFGLFENSPAVIIGAMLIAMLFGPIVGIALGLAEADMQLLGRSVVSEVAGAVWVLAIGFGLGVVFPDLPIGREILSRTSPVTLDLLIALVGGLAGAFTYFATGISGVIVGVAIATALVPPLTTCGILLARGLTGLAAGALLLFLANFAAISLGAMVVFFIAGHRPPVGDRARRRAVVVPRMIALVLFALLAVHLTNTFLKTVGRSLLQSNIRTTLDHELTNIPGARLDEVTLVPQQGRTAVLAVVRSPQTLTPEQVAQLNDKVNAAAGTNVELLVRSVIATEVTRQGILYRPDNFRAQR
ncbi:MAG TPA: TIGR00341 family protein [Acetobacteraceae bacterium]|nr:TIGR00341 family protein [Acetobacteraceae bacterium]